MAQEARKLCLDALSSGRVKILVSDGQCDNVKGFGDSRDNIPAILELAEDGVLSISDSVAAMTRNPALLFRKTTGQEWWEKTGHLGPGAYANVTIINPKVKLAAYTIVNGIVTAFEKRLLRNYGNAGGFVSRHGLIRSFGTGMAPIFSRA
jgi:dihydroorotase-like cyclic amidohydrolase